MAPLDHFGNWEFRGNLGRGGFGEVHRWRHGNTGLEIATKRLQHDALASISADEQRKLFERWLKEYEWTRELVSCPHIVRGVRLDDEANAAFVNYLNAQHCCPQPVILLEYCNGGDVRQLLQRSENVNGLVEYEVRQILSALRSAIHFLHTHCRIYHRDLKPDNIVIQRTPDRGKIYKLTDFGFARRSPEQTMQQSVVGTPNYFAPEIVDTAKYNHKIDYWSMGVIAYELCCGVLPFIPHQKLFNIISNIRKKPRECIAISEEDNNENQECFIFHKELPPEQRLSKVWCTKFTPWLRMALDTDYKSRGSPTLTNGTATDEVQTPFIFSALDKLLECKVLTAFSVCSYKMLAYEVTAELSMSEFQSQVIRDAGINVPHFVLPTGHPHKRITQYTRPIDLFVAAWQDTSTEAKNPPVMLYICNGVPKCEFNAPDPCLSTTLQKCLAQRPKTLKHWLNERLVLDVHFLLSDQQRHLKMFLAGLKEYAMTLEDDMLSFEPWLKELTQQMQQMCGALEHFKLLQSAAQKYTEQWFNNAATLAAWHSNWQKLCKKYEDTVMSIERVLEHFESALRSAREEAKNNIYDELSQLDVYEVARFQEKYLLDRRSLSMTEIEEMLSEFAQKRAQFLQLETESKHESQVRKLHNKINQSHKRFAKIPKACADGLKAIAEIKAELLHLELQLFQQAATVQQERRDAEMQASMQQLSLTAASHNENALDTPNIITRTFEIMQLLETDMDTEESA